MEVSKEDLESFVKEQLDNVFAFTILTNDGMVITKYGENYHMETSPGAAESVLAAVSKIGSVNDKN